MQSLKNNEPRPKFTGSYKEKGFSSSNSFNDLTISVLSKLEDLTGTN